MNEERFSYEPIRRDSFSVARKRLGRKPQAGGAIAVLLGVLILVAAVPSPPSLVDLHKLAYAFIGIGVFLFVLGTVWRWFYLDEGR